MSWKFTAQNGVRQPQNDCDESNDLAISGPLDASPIHRVSSVAAKIRTRMTIPLATIHSSKGEPDRRANTGTSLRPRTIFFGGGTPTLLPIDEMRRLILGLRDRIDFSNVMEFTCEANPATV